MPFGSTNAPVSFQRFLNNIFSDILDVYIIINILIFSGNKDDHYRHVTKVLQWLQKHGLYASGKKCGFHLESVDYLGYLIRPNGLQMNPAKVKVIQDWPEPQKVKNIQPFSGFANRHRCYIHNYSNIVVLLTCLTQRNIHWNFNKKCKLAFLSLKKAFILAPVLTHYKPNCLLVIETDASDYALAAILFQVEPNRDIHPITYLFWTFSDTKLNYDTHDKELMAIYKAFKGWKYYLEGANVQIDIVTDHKNLEYCCTTQILSRRQACQSTFLFGFNMVIRFWPGHLRTNQMLSLDVLTSTQKGKERGRKVLWYSQSLKLSSCFFFHSVVCFSLCNWNVSGNTPWHCSHGYWGASKGHFICLW